ncbi:MAG: TonB-dependent receptor, partial [Sphingobacteriales bacterium]
MKIVARLSIVLLSVLLVLPAVLFSQSTPDFLLKGVVTDSVTGATLPAASIQVFNLTDNKLVTGKLSGDAGVFEFRLPAGSYRAEFNYTGYKAFEIARFSLGTTNPVMNTGIIKLISSGKVLDEVIVQAEKSSMTLTLDKKVFNVGRDLANAGGSAADILSNIPSVSVDPEGGIKLRGSDNVRILIDGKPSGLVSFKGGSGLQQLQASMIDRVEIITNPSARYEAEGNAGILNIILKKDKRQGFNGSFEVTTGYPANLGAAANLNYR